MRGVTAPAPDPERDRRIWLEAKYGREATYAAQLKKDLATAGFDLFYHVPYSIGAKPGFPDVIAINSTTHIAWVAELKGSRPQYHAEQQRWLDAWAKVQRIVCAGIVHPRDYDRTVAQIARLSGRITT